MPGAVVTENTQYLGNTIYLVIFLTVISGLMEGLGIGLIIPLLESFEEEGASLTNVQSNNFFAVFEYISIYLFKNKNYQESVYSFELE